MIIVFFKSKEYPDHYFLYRGINGTNVEEKFQKFTHTGEHYNSGYLHMEIERGPEFTTQLPNSFFEFLVEKIATNHIPHPKYDAQNYRAWYEFKKIDFDSWHEQFERHQADMKKAFASEVPKNGIQITLF